MTTSRTARDYGFGLDFTPTGTRTGGLPALGGTPFQQFDAPSPVVPGTVSQQSRDASGNPVAAPAAPYVAPELPANIYGNVIGQYQPPAAPAVSTTPAADTPATPAAFAGSPLNTLYGIDSESNLTEDQKKLARMIQGKFDASLNRRDRELAQYGAPRLASFVEDEALARAMSLARGLNIPVQDALGMVQGSGPASRGSTGGGGGGSGGTGRAPTSVTTPRASTQANPVRVAQATTPRDASPAQASKWQQVLAGLSTYIPLLFGKEGMNVFGNKGLVGMVQNAYKSVFGNDPPPFTYNVVSDMLNGGDGFTTVNEITGGLDSAGNMTNADLFNVPGLTGSDMPMSGGFGPVDPFGPYGQYGDMAMYGDYSGGGAFVGPEYVPPDYGYDDFGGGDWWSGGDGGFDFGGGDWLDLGGDTSYWMPDDLFSSGDPFGIGGW